MITKEQLYNLYIIQNKSRVQVARELNLSVSQIYRYCIKYGIKKDLKLVALNIKETFKQKYGVENISQLAEIKEKKKETAKRLYNTDTYFKTEEFKKKAKAIRLSKYGDENYNNRKKAQISCIERYGVDNPSKVLEIKNKKVNTYLKKFGTTNPSKVQEIKDKKRKTVIEHYGVHSTMLIPEIKEKVVTKGYLTRKENGTFNGKSTISIDNKIVKCSKFEKYVYNKLKIKFKNIQYQYKSEQYPFVCDFYISELDLYIECQGTWEHGFSPYIGSVSNLIQLDKWKKRIKQSKRYKYAIEVWTIRDPLKRQIAKQNNLNWIEFFTIKEFENWFKNLP